MKTKLQSDGTIMPHSSAAVGCAVATFDLLEWGTGQTIIMVTHEPDIDEKVDRIIRLKDGRMV